MKILVLNCGSSSIKYKLFDMTTKEVIAQGGIEKIGLKGSCPFTTHIIKDISPVSVYVWDFHK